MHNLVQKSFGVHLRLLQILGMFPSKQSSKLYNFYTYFMFFVMITPIPILVTVNLLLQENLDVVQISDNAFLTCQMACLAVKTVYLIWNKEEVRKSIEMLEKPIFVTHMERQDKLMDECIRTCKRNCWFFLIFCIISLIAWAPKPIVQNSKKLPLEIYFPVDFTAFPALYYVTYLYVVLGVSAGALTNGVIDPLIAGLASHATVQMKILKNTLQFLSEDTDRFIAETNSLEKHFLKNRLIQEKVRFCIIHHNAILNFIENFENVYSGIVFSQFAASVFIICINCFYLSIVEPFSVFFFTLIILLVTFLLEIFLYCYYGTLLFEENNTLTTAVYMGKWYKYDVASRKALILLMERSKKPMTVRAGKILDLSLETFTTILRRAYSLLAVLKNY